jgi:hypothetical protein
VLAGGFQGVETKIKMMLYERLLGSRCIGSITGMVVLTIVANIIDSELSRRVEGWGPTPFHDAAATQQLYQLVNGVADRHVVKTEIQDGKGKLYFDGEWTVSRRKE